MKYIINRVGDKLFILPYIVVTFLMSAQVHASPAADQHSESLAIGKAIVESYCASCHPLSSDAFLADAPTLVDIVGRLAVEVEGFNYSEALVSAMKENRWTRENLDAFLTDTQAFAPGSAMLYFNADPGMRTHIIDYLATLK